MFLSFSRTELGVHVNRVSEGTQRLMGVGRGSQRPLLAVCDFKLAWAFYLLPFVTQDSLDDINSPKSSLNTPFS